MLLIYFSLIGHEGKGSILSLLRELGWANDLSAGEAHSCTDWSSFAVNISLTDAGLDHVDDVVEIFFAYVALLRKAGPQRWVHDETATVAVPEAVPATAVHSWSFTPLQTSHSAEPAAGHGSAR